MIALTYLSTATEPFAESDLLNLLELSRRNNHGAGLTGMLLYADGHFIQTIEGDPDDVEATFARISGDPRHRDILVALQDDVDERVFPEWSMGFEEISEERAAEMPGFDDFLRTAATGQAREEELGRAGVFHRVFRDRMRSTGRLS